MLAVHIDCYAGSRGEETPRRFRLGDRLVEIEVVVERWQTPDQSGFRARTAAGETYVLRQDVGSGALEVAGLERTLIMGTAGYMSTEQARGKTVDKRGDIWAFGAVLYEMLSGQRVFQGDDVSLTLAKVIEKEPTRAGGSAPSVECVRNP